MLYLRVRIFNSMYVLYPCRYITTRAFQNEISWDDFRDRRRRSLKMVIERFVN